MTKRYACPACNIYTKDLIPSCHHFEQARNKQSVEQKMALQAHIEAGEAAITEAAKLRREIHLLSINNDVYQAFIYENDLKIRYQNWLETHRLNSDC